MTGRKLSTTPVGTYRVYLTANTVLSDPRATVEDPEWLRFDSDDPTDVARWLTDGRP